MCSSEDTPELIRGLGRQEWAGILDKLADIGLLRKTKGGDYVAHPTLPWFFNNSLRLTFADHLIWLERTFTAVYKQASLEFNELFNINTRLAMSVLRSEEENLLYALRLALRHRCWDGAEGLLYGLNRLFTTQYRWAEWEQIIGSLESRIAGASARALARQKNLRRAIQGYKAQIFRYFGDVRSARVIDTELLEDYAPDDHNLATALYNIGESAHREGNQEEAKRHYLQCLAIERRINDKLNQARTRNSLGAVAQAQSQWTEAEHWYVQSLPLKEELGDEKGRVRTLNNIGTLAEGEGKLTEASLWYLQSLDIVRDMDDRPEECQILQNLGALAGEQEQWQEAERWLRQGLAIAENIHDDRTKAFIFHNLGNVALAQEAIDEAERWYRQSLAIRECIGDEHGKAETLFQLALIAEIRGNREEAVRLCQQAESIFKRFNDQYALEKVRQFLQRIQSGVQS
jgi:tetratricopeptide (TPR) repeat protein